jgi:opacity protein-like surface antigen
MNRITKGFTISAAMIAMTAMPALSQTGWGSLGINTGWMNPAHHAEGPQTSMGFDETVSFGADLDFWFGESRRWGLGLAGNYSGWNEWDTDFGGDFGHPVDMFQYDASLQFRLAEPTFDTRILPFLSLGIGAVTTNPDNDPDSPFPTDVGLCANGGGSSCQFLPADVMLDQSTQTQLAAVGGVGLDWFLTPNVAVRLEAKDYWTDRSPYRRISTTEFHDGGHNIQLNGGLAMYLGRARVEEPGFVREEPIIVTPAPEPEPVPVPVVREESVMMCVVDENGFGLRTVQAVRVIDENRVYVTRNGQRVAFTTAYPATAPIYVRNATWYMADRPMTIQLETNPAIAVTDRNRIELVLFGSPAQRGAGDLAFVGTIDGTPVYASRSDVAPFRTRLESQLTTTTDLATILRADAELAREFGEVNTYYVAVEPNCVFRPVSVTHFVRRTRG